jgi:hypothetical protein
MPNDNNFLPKENLAKVEEVREIEENEIIMPEEQVKVIDYFKERQNLIKKKSRLSPAARSKVIKRYGSDYLSERAFTHDIAVMQMYGPGWLEWVAKTTIVVGGGFILGPIPAMVVGGVTAAGAKIGENLSDHPDDKKVFKFIGDCGGGIAQGGAIGGLVQGVGGVLAADLGGAGSNVGRSAAIKALKATGDFAVARSEYLFAASKYGAKVVGDIDK